jgi:brefeldin A-inhibited guanine nucleotide-exchange protein
MPLLADYHLSRSKKLPAEELANESRSTHITVAADMVFSLSHYLSGVSHLRDLIRFPCDLTCSSVDCYRGFRAGSL